jgi:hypothetical protein
MPIQNTHYVVNFHHIDDYRCLRPLSEAVSEPHFEAPDPAELKAQEDALRAELAEFFSEAGWEGDGEINCIFMPPCFIGGEDGWCVPVYHVKQNNNGTSWLAIPNGMELSLPEGMF